MTLAVGVIGAGVMGTDHVRTLSTAVAGARVAAVADADEARAQEAARVAEGSRVYADPRELVAAPEVDGVVIASSDATHEGFVLACLEAGKPVLCEKPLAASATASLRVVEAEAALGRRLVSVGFMRRYDPAYVGIKARLDAGEVGDPLLVHCAHRNASVPPAYSSEMLITSSAVHEFDVLRWLLSEEIVAATVLRPRRSAQAAHGLQDPQLLVLESEGGRFADVEVFVNARYGYDIRCEVVGEQGAVALEERPGASVAADFRDRFAAAYRLELQAWVDGLADGPSHGHDPGHGGGGAGANAWDGYAASAVADACLASLSDGNRAEVRLAPRPSLA